MAVTTPTSDPLEERVASVASGWLAVCVCSHGPGTEQYLQQPLRNAALFSKKNHTQYDMQNVTTSNGISSLSTAILSPGCLQLGAVGVDLGA